MLVGLGFHGVQSLVLLDSCVSAYQVLLLLQIVGSRLHRWVLPLVQSVPTFEALAYLQRWCSETVPVLSLCR